jgi:O-antigen/teichoic acid export membrane protein
MFRMKGNLVPPTIIGLFAIAIGAITLLSPHRANVSVAVWGALAGLFGVYVLCGVVVSWRARR